MSLASFTQVFGQTVITNQPQSQSVSLGANVTFSVSASGSEPFSYQWRRNETALAGETNATLTLTNVQVTHAGSYTVVVIDGFNESVTSEAAVLTVDPTFTKITAGQVVTDLDEFAYAAWGDYDNDGFVDLLFGANKKTSLYRNNGDGTFTKITSGALVTDARGDGNPLWGDYDNDGFLDVYVLHSDEP